MPTAADPFPQGVPDPASLVGLIDQAVSRRLDLSAATKASEAGDVIVEGARRNLASRLDVSGGVFFTALGEGKGGDTLDRWVGPSARVGLDYEKPFGNNTQRGQLTQAEAAAAQRRIGQFDLERQIRLGVVEAAGSLQQAAARVDQARASVGYYDRTIESMMRLLGAGNARLIDALTTRTAADRRASCRRLRRARAGAAAGATAISDRVLARGRHLHSARRRSNASQELVDAPAFACSPRSQRWRCSPPCRRPRRSRRSRPPRCSFHGRIRSRRCPVRR